MIDQDEVAPAARRILVQPYAASPPEVERTHGVLDAYVGSSIKLDPAWIAAVVGCSYVLGFIVVNAHVGRFRPLEYELLEARYLAASLLFVTLTAPPAVMTLMLIGRLKTPPWGPARHWPKWRIWAARSVLCAAVLVLGFYLWELTLETAAIAPRFARTRDAVGYLVFAIGICLGREAWVMIRANEAVPEHPRNLDLDRFNMNALTAVMVLSLVLQFSSSIFPNLKPELGGGGAWVARVVPEAGALPADVAARLSPDVVILEAGDDYLTLLLCPAKPGDALEPAVVARSRFTLVSVSGVIAARQLGTRCAGRQRALPPSSAPPAPAGQSRAGSTSQTP